MSSNNTCSIAAVIEEFTRFYSVERHATGHLSPRNPVVKYLATRNEMLTTYHLGHLQHLVAIVDRDAATAALAVGWVLHCRGSEVKFVTNGTHVYLSHAGHYYDALNPKGTPRETDVYGYRPAVKSISLSFKDAFEKYMIHDEDGILLLHSFVNRAKVPSFLFRQPAGAGEYINYLERID